MHEAASPPSEISSLLARWRDGDRDAMERLFALVYDEMRRRAHGQLRRSAAPTLGTHTLVHETFLRLLEQKQVLWTDRGHFFAKAGHITPVPGGVGPMTVAMLLKNTLRSAEILFGLHKS